MQQRAGQQTIVEEVAQSTGQRQNTSKNPEDAGPRAAAPSATSAVGTPASTYMTPNEPAMTVMSTAKTASRLRTPRRSMSSSANESTAVTSTPAHSGTAPRVSSDSAIAQPITWRPRGACCGHAVYAL